jgi:hypothetical protein
MIRYIVNPFGEYRWKQWEKNSRKRIIPEKCARATREHTESGIILDSLIEDDITDRLRVSDS